MNVDIATVVAGLLSLDDILNARGVCIQWSQLFPNPPMELLHCDGIVVAASRREYYVNLAGIILSSNSRRMRLHMITHQDGVAIPVRVCGRCEHVGAVFINNDDVAPFYDDLRHIFGCITARLPIFVRTRCAAFSKSPIIGAPGPHCGATIVDGAVIFTDPALPAQYVQIVRYISGDYQK